MIKIKVEQDLLPKNQRISPVFLEKLQAGLLDLEKANGEIALTIVDDAEIQRLNRMYRNKDEITDVLSFGYGDTGFLGDVAISWPQVQRQSQGDDQLELADLIIHGCLHVLGFDHEDSQDAKEMFTIQDKLLKNVL